MKKVAIFVILTLILVSAVVLAAQLGPEIRWWSVDGGAETSSGGDYTLSGIIGQPDAGPSMSDGSYTVTGGYWHAGHEPVGPEEWTVFLPVIQK